MTQARPFAEELEELKRRLLAMGGLAEERLRMVVRAVVNRDHDTLALVIALKRLYRMT
jgi:phosphate uptake regulator